MKTLNREHFFTKIFLGKNQSKIAIDLVQEMQALGHRAEWIKMDGNGPNALDFHIAYYLGVLSTQDKSAFFHIISKDTGFDPLIAHLKSCGIFCAREEGIEKILVLKIDTPTTMEGRLAAVKAKLPKARPRTLKTLRSSIAVIFKSVLNEVEIEDIIQTMVQNGDMELQNEKPIYKF